ncbi:MAG: hypothetical protein UH654_06720, partial [Lachnospiraceae bacterium]|nr:hypothetical protein [Lachnospiraceae bacterium]
MNKFTRSQMGKIMAYALSAAMAVTVVPTYMMKPLTVKAETDGQDTSDTTGDTATPETKLVKKTEVNESVENATISGEAAEKILTISDLTKAVPEIKIYIVKDTDEKTAEELASETAVEGTKSETTDGKYVTTIPNSQIKGDNGIEYTIWATYKLDTNSKAEITATKLATFTAKDSDQEAPTIDEAVKENFKADDAGENYTYTVDAPKPTIVFSVDKKADNASDSNAESQPATQSETTVEGTVKDGTATVEVSELEKLVTAAGEYKVSYVYNPTGATEDVTESVDVATITATVSTDSKDDTDKDDDNKGDETTKDGTLTVVSGASTSAVLPGDVLDVAVAGAKKGETYYYAVDNNAGAVKFKSASTDTEEDLEVAALADEPEVTATAVEVKEDGKVQITIPDTVKGNENYYIHIGKNANAVSTVDTTTPITVAAALSTSGSITDGRVAKSSFKYGDKLAYNVPDFAGGDITIALFPTTLATGEKYTKEKAVYMVDSASTEVQVGVNGSVVSFYLSDEIPEGSYYIAALPKKVKKNLTNADKFETLKPENIVEVKKDSIASGLTLASEKSTISFATTNDTFTYSNSERLTTELKGGTKYSDITYTFKQLDKDGKTTRGAFTVKNAETGEEVTSVTLISSAKLPDFTVEGADNIAEGATLVCEVQMHVAGMVNPYRRTYTFTAKKDLSLVSGIVLTADEYILAGDKTTVETKKIPESSNETLTYTFAGTDTSNAALVEKVSGTVHSLYDSATKKTLYATFDEATGEIVTKKAGIYTVTADGKNCDAVRKTVKALEFTFNTSGMVIGSTNASLSGKVESTSGLDSTKGYVTYTVADDSIATINNSTVAYGTALTANALSTGITKVTADITVYGSTKTYNFTKDGYIVVAPKITDKDFVLTSIPDTEAYINGLESTGNFYSGLKVQAAEAIIDDEIDASKLTYDAYSEVNEAAAIEYSGYYDIYNSSVTGNEAVGLILAAADRDVLDVEDPSKPVTVRYTVSDLQEKDKVYKQKDSVVDFVSEMTVNGEVTELKKPIWLNVTNSKLEANEIYTVYDDGVAIYTAKANANNTLTFQTDSFSVFSIVATPDAKLTDNSSKVEEPDETDDIYDKVNFSA